MTPTRLILAQSGTGRLDLEESLLAQQAHALGIPVVLGSEKMMARGRIVLTPSDLVAGTVPFVLHALRQLGVAPPIPNPYPSALAPWLKRKVHWEPCLAKVLKTIEIRDEPLFVKPAQGWKRYTGCVIHAQPDPRLSGVSRRSPVWTSSIIALRSEWRAYVVNVEIRAIKRYAGDPRHPVDTHVIQEAVSALVLAGEAPSAFAIDFGQDDQGQTVLVELNDGFAIGAYDGLAADIYWEVVSTRWFDLIAS